MHRAGQRSDQVHRVSVPTSRPRLRQQHSTEILDFELISYCPCLSPECAVIAFLFHNLPSPRKLIHLRLKHLRRGDAFQSPSTEPLQRTLDLTISTQLRRSGILQFHHVLLLRHVQRSINLGRELILWISYEERD